MTKRVCDLTGADLDRAVANAHGMMLYTPDWQPSRRWEQAGPLIEAESIATIPNGCGTWQAYKVVSPSHAVGHAYSSSQLVAAMRCYVASRLGEEIDDESI
jgi:hypothetical protein